MSDPFKHFFFWHTGVLSAFSIILTVGCTPKLYWAKSDARPGEFEEDANQCRQTLLSDPGISKSLSNLFNLSEDAVGQCLMAKGWFLAEKP